MTRKKINAEIHLGPKDTKVEVDFCCKCGRRRPVKIMHEVGFLVYMCRECLLN